jgi:hypothetical protein
MRDIQYRTQRLILIEPLNPIANESIHALLHE